MKLYSNLKIRAKFGVGIGMIIIIIAALVAIMFFMMILATENFTYLETYPRTRHQQLNEATISFRMVQHHLFEMNLHMHSQSMEGNAHQLGQSISDESGRLFTLLGAYRDSIIVDPRYASIEGDALIRDIDQIINLAESWIEHAANPATQAFLADNYILAADILLGYASLSDQIINRLYALKAVTAGYINASAEETTAFAFQVVIIFCVVAVVAILFVIGLMLLMNNSIVVPIKRLSVLVNDLAEGNLNVNIDRSQITNDEIGDLTQAVAHMADTLLRLMDDIHDVLYAFNKEGDLNARMDSSHYEGSYNKIVENFNELIESLVRDLLVFLNAVNAFSLGTFTEEIPRQVGTKAIMHETLEDFRDTILAITEDISGLATAAAEGKLDIRVNANKYSGDWVSLVDSLNYLAQATATPIAEVESVLRAVAEGDFSEKVKGNYKGEFLNMKESLNYMITNVDSYITEISGVLGALAKDDLDQGITREYVGQFTEIKDALNHIIDRFNQVIANILYAAEEVSGVAQRISENSERMATGAANQAASVGELNKTIHTINEATHRNAENAFEAKVLSDTSSTNAARGDQDINAMLTAMEGIRDSSGQISAVIKVINDIAFQTNLLALNAAVEAARAGEHGKGFSVVAEEVRNLAGRSKKAAMETAGLIEKSIGRVNDGTQIAEATAETLRNIVGDVNKVAEIINGISDASSKQADAIEQVSTGISQITEVVQKNSTSSEIAASASQQLASQSEVLRNLVSVFKMKK
ncbi:MAG: methyl-accepting chemotaxis protein [Defluviitaleaceae bacterium]|nr:methyl-accepting chemotaxis protein [Defluviitaleaceae bacterium]